MFNSSFQEIDTPPDDKRFIKQAVDEKIRGNFAGYPPYSSGGPYLQNHKPVFNLYPFSTHSTISSEQLKKHLPEQRTIKEEVVDKKPMFSSHATHTVNTVHPSSAYLPKDLKREPHNSVIVKRDIKPEMKMEHPVAAHSHHNSPSSSSPRPPHPRPAHTPEHRPERPLSSSTSPASSIPPHFLHHSSSGSGAPHHSHNAAFRAVEAHVSRSQSPYRPVASQSHQSQHSMPMALDYHKSSAPNKLKVGDAHPAVAHQIYSSAPPVSAVSTASAYSFSLIQQGLVPNPIYSQVGGQHSSEQLGQPRMPTSVAGAPPRSQHSPPGMKRKPTPSNKDPNLYNRKKLKTQAEMSNQVVSIPVTTPEILTNQSPYTTTSSNSVFSKPGSTSINSSSSPSLSASNISSLNSSKVENFKSFVDNAVYSAFQQENEKKEKAEREKVNSGSLSNNPIYTKIEPNHNDRKPEVSQAGRQHIVSPHVAAAQTLQSDNISTPSVNIETPTSSITRIIDTINRVANNQTDTDSDTLSASSPPPTVKPVDTNNSPLSRTSNSVSSHPHHMKKAWLQRHDEDKKSEAPAVVAPPPPPPPPPVASAPEEHPVKNNPQPREGISCVENPGAHGEGGLSNMKSSPASVVVTLPNGNISDLSQRNDESTSSASEAEMQVSIAKSFRVVIRNY